MVRVFIWVCFFFLLNGLCYSQDLMRQSQITGNTIVDGMPFDSSNSAISEALPPCTTSPNNNFANAINLVIGAATISGTTCGNLQAGEQLGCNSTATQSVWYKFTATAATSYVIIDATGSNCYVGSCIWPGASLPTNKCTMINCQAAANGPLVTVYRISGAIGTSYAVQITYGAGGPCQTQGVFTIRAANTYTGVVSNPGPTNTCNTPTPGCYFTSTPTLATVTSTCTSYPLTTQANLVNNSFFSFTTAPINSNVLSLQNIINSTCGGGNVSWFFYRLYDANCNLLVCGDLGSLVNNVACNTNYKLEYMWEELNCTYNLQYPYQYAPTGTVGCGTLPVELLWFKANGNGNNVVLNWETGSEINNDFFAIERSFNSSDFERIGTVKGSGNSTKVNLYHFTDRVSESGVYYYRLIQTDFDGHAENFGPVAYRNFKDDKFYVNYSPEENSVNLYFNCSESQPLDFEIYYNGGVLKYNLSKFFDRGFHEEKIKVSLPSGIYTVVMKNNQSIAHQKFIVLH